MKKEKKSMTVRQQQLIGLLRGMLICFVYFIFAANSVFAAGTGNEVITKAVSLLSTGASTLGGILAVWSLVSLGLAFKDHNGPGQQQAIGGIIGGAIVCGAGVYLGTLQIDFSV